MKRTSNPAETAILISKKAYIDFTSRIRQTLGAIELSPESIDEAVALFDRYVKGETADLGSTDLMVKLALMMLKPEIDKAARRSSAARERARLRREKSIADPESHETPKSPEYHGNHEDEDSKIMERPMNRRERREYERELAREERRYERRLMRMKKAAIS